MRTMRQLGRKGRFANQLFQYAYLRLTSPQGYQCAPWVGQYLFGHDDPAVTFKFWQAKERKVYEAEKSNLATLDNVDLVGHFQYHTRYYAPHKEAFRALFQPTEAIKEVVRPQVDALRAAGRTLVGLHLRRGDYGSFRRKSARWCFVAPTDWYRRWLDDYLGDLIDPIVFIASDDLDDVVGDFADYDPHVSTVEMPEASFYPDFYTLSKCDYLLISNSSFGFAASMLAADGVQCWRPRLSQKRLVPYDPWSAYTVYTDELYD